MNVCRGAAHVVAAYRCPSHTLPLVLLAVAFALPALISLLVQWKGQ